jgi:hypothetical protein
MERIEEEEEPCLILLYMDIQNITTRPRSSTEYTKNTLK